MYELIGQARPILYTAAMWDRLGGHNPYDDLDITNRPDEAAGTR